MSQIIVEGPDGSGKTTFLREMSSLVGKEIRQRDYVDSITGPVPDLFLWVKRDIQMWGQPGSREYIWDRHPMISEYIYGPHVRGRVSEGFDSVQAQLILRYIQAEVKLIVCLPPFHEVLANIERDKGLQAPWVTRPNIAKIYSSYASLIKNWPGQVQVWDYTMPRNWNPL